MTYGEQGHVVLVTSDFEDFSSLIVAEYSWELACLNVEAEFVC